MVIIIFFRNINLILASNVIGHHRVSIKLTLNIGKVVSIVDFKIRFEYHIGLLPLYTLILVLAQRARIYLRKSLLFKSRRYSK